MGDKKNYTQKNFDVYTNMVKYVRNLKMLEVNKREINQKLYNMYVNLSSKNVDLKEYVVNPKTFCDNLCSDYVKNTSMYLIYLETLKKFSIVVAILALFCDLFLDRPLVSKYFVYILVSAFVVSIILTYFKLYRSNKYGLGKEPLSYKILYNLVSLILLIPLFILRNDIKRDGDISIIFIGIISIFIFFISALIIKLNKNNINKKISCKSIN